MHTRVTCTGHYNFKNYGGRGIRICDRWHEFVNFLADMGPRPPGTTLDRIDTNGHYEAANCRWATTHEQRNNCRNTRYLTHDGVTRTAAQWTRFLKWPTHIIDDRLAAGWSVERTLATPIKTHARHITYRGRTQSIAQWEREFGWREGTLKHRLLLGWTVDRAMTQPVRKSHRL
jgi:hypothetical protein